MNQIEIEQQLQSIMKREIGLLREFLGSMESEQQAIMVNDTALLKSIFKERDPLLEQLLKVREQRIGILKVLAGVSEDGDAEGQEAMEKLFDSDVIKSPELFMMRDQMLALLEKMQVHFGRNNNLLGKKVDQTRKLINRLHPADTNTTYSMDGKSKGKGRKTTITLINREG